MKFITLGGKKERCNQNNIDVSLTKGGSMATGRSTHDMDQLIIEDRREDEKENPILLPDRILQDMAIRLMPTSSAKSIVPIKRDYRETSDDNLFGKYVQ
jgi:hypothetical protein